MKISNHLVIGCCYWCHCVHAHSKYKITAKSMVHNNYFSSKNVINRTGSFDNKQLPIASFHEILLSLYIVSQASLFYGEGLACETTLYIETLVRFILNFTPTHVITYSNNYII